jgi:hypothetical protein
MATVSDVIVDNARRTVVLVELEAADGGHHSVVLRVDNFGFAENRLRRWKEAGMPIMVTGRSRTRMVDFYQPDTGKRLCLPDLTAFQ